MYVSVCLHACLCTMYMPATQRGKKVLDPLEEEIFVSHHPDMLGIKTRFSGREASPL